MARVLIMENNGAIRAWLQAHIPWQELGIDAVITANSGEEGLALSKTLLPDLVIGDVNLPGISPIEVCRSLREDSPACQFLLVGKSLEMPQRKAAQELGAVDCMEEPLCAEEVKQAICRALRRNRQAKLSCLGLPGLLLHPARAEQHSESGYQILLIRQKEWLQDVLSLKSLCEQLLRDPNGPWQGRVDFLAEPWGDDLLAVLLSAGTARTLEDRRDAEQFCKGLLDGTASGSRFLGIGEPVQGVENVRSSYESAKAALRSMAHKGWNGWAFWDEPVLEFQGGISIQEQLQFRRMLTQQNREGAAGILNAWRDMLLRERAELSLAVRNVYYLLNLAILEAKEELQLDTAGDRAALKALDHAATIGELHSFTADCMDTIWMDRELPPGSQKVHRTVFYIQRNFSSKNLSIKVLADEVYLTPTYLSSIFKKETGLTIGEYITRVRMEHARELLLDRSLKLHQVADRVGFEDPNYFAKIFKKSTGLLPSEYRGRLL